MLKEKTINSAFLINEGEKVSLSKWLNTALFDLNTRLGRTVNIFSMLVIVFSVALSMISTLDVITPSQKLTIEGIEFAVSIGFTIEYFLRLLSAKRPLAYAFSFYGLIDLLTWLPLLFFGDANLAIRLLRLMRLLKLIRYLRAIHLFLSSLQDTIDSLIVVICAIIIIILFAGNLIHTVEPETFPDAFIGSWWALVTMTTVGYGDVVPNSGVGKLIAAGLMLSGIAMFAMLTATISVKIAAVINREQEEKEHLSGVAKTANYCPNCGVKQGEKTPYLR
jgi:voltage-gated potassium channel